MCLGKITLALNSQTDQLDDDFRDIFEGECHQAKSAEPFTFIVTCDAKQVKGRKIDGGPPVVIAEDLGDVPAVAVAPSGRWMALGLGSQVWVIAVVWSADTRTIKGVGHKATLDGHTSSIFRLEFLNGKHYTYLAGFIFVRTIFVQNGKCSPFLELTPTL